LNQDHAITIMVVVLTALQPSHPADQDSPFERNVFDSLSEQVKLKPMNCLLSAPTHGLD